MGPWYDIAVHMHWDDPRRAEERRRADPPHAAGLSWAPPVLTGVLVLLVALV